MDKMKELLEKHCHGGMCRERNRESDGDRGRNNEAMNESPPAYVLCNGTQIIGST